MMTFFEGLGQRFYEVFLAMVPIVAIYIVLSLMGMKMEKPQRRRIVLGFVVSYIGLVFFLHGVTVSFRPIGEELGKKIAESDWLPILPLLGFVMGFVVAFAEPAVWVLNNQVEEMTAGSVKKVTMLLTISIGVAFAVMLSMFKIMFQLPIWLFVGIGYFVIFLLSKVGGVEPTFLAIAFDSGGVATGPMCSTFVMSFSLGAAKQIPGADPMTDGLGMVSLVAMAPILAILLMSFIYKQRDKMIKKLAQAKRELQEADAIDMRR